MAFSHWRQTDRQNVAWEPSFSKECGLGRSMELMSHGILLTPMPASKATEWTSICPPDPWLLPSRTGRSTGKKASACTGRPQWALLVAGGGQWAERLWPPLSSLSVNESAHAEPPEQACQGLLPPPRAQGEGLQPAGLCAYRLCPLSSCCSRMETRCAPGAREGSGEAQVLARAGRKLLPLGGSGSTAHLGPEPEG